MVGAFFKPWNGISLLPDCHGDDSLNWSCKAPPPGSNGHGHTIRRQSILLPRNSSQLLLAWHFGVGHVQVVGSCSDFITKQWSPVSTLSLRSARNPALVHFLRCLFFLEDFVCHVPESDNAATDALSWNNPSLFISLFLQAPVTQHLFSPALGVPGRSAGHPVAGSSCWRLCPETGSQD